MFICRACARRATSNILGRAVFPDSQRVIPAPSRAFATTSYIKQRIEYDRRGPEGNAQDEPEYEPEGEQERQGSAQSERVGFLKQVDKEKEAKKLKWMAKKHLQTLDDPYHIAEDVKRTLQKGQYDKALAITREASKDRQVVVSWNYLIGHLFEKQKMAAALKVFNEMKKRAQLPNAQTFTTIFAGCARSEHPKLAANEAIKIYNMMLASPRLKPNIIHLNAVIEACSRAGEIEVMFTLLQTATHNRTPTKMTYTTVLNALRLQPSNYREADVAPGEEDEAIEHSRRQTIERAKAVWEEVVSRWNKAQISVDEELMCAMGRILLLGQHRDTENCLALVEQVTGIPKLGEDNVKKPQVESTTLQPWPATPNKRGPQPGNNTLSLIMVTLGKLRRTKLASKYWDHMTSLHEFMPDRKNWIDYLNALASGHASSQAARAISTMHKDMVSATFIHKALMICLRDALNEHAFDHATMVIQRMFRCLPIPDARCMQLFLQISIVNSKKFFDKKKWSDTNAGKLAYGRQIMEALDRLWEPLMLATNAQSYPTQNTISPEEAHRMNHVERNNLLELAQKIVAANDKIVMERLAEPNDLTLLRTRRNVVNSYVNRARAKKERFGPMESGAGGAKTHASAA